MRKILISICLLTMSTFIMAQGNVSDVGQTGNNNDGGVDQVGLANDSDLD